MAASLAAFRITVPAMPRPTRILTWLMLAMLVGGHWGMLQVVAWTGMLIDFSREASFAEAWDKTFAGEHPCAICKTVDRGIAEALADEGGEAPGKSCKTMKLDALVSAIVLTMPAPGIAVLSPPRRPDLAHGLTVEPRRRPPRAMG